MTHEKQERIQGQGGATPGAGESHITIVTRMGSRRIMGRVGTREQLCGAEPTLKDQLIIDARREAASGELAKWVTCANCRAALPHIPRGLSAAGILAAARAALRKAGRE